MPHILHCIDLQLELGSCVITLGINKPILHIPATVVVPLCTLLLMVYFCHMLTRHRFCVHMCAHFYEDHLD